MLQLLQSNGRFNQFCQKIDDGMFLYRSGAFKNTEHLNTTWRKIHISRPNVVLVLHKNDVCKLHSTDGLKDLKIIVLKIFDIIQHNTIQ